LSIKIPESNIVVADGKCQDLAQLFPDAEDAEGKTLKTKKVAKN
jgi:hypothetical protein